MSLDWTCSLENETNYGFGLRYKRQASVGEYSLGWKRSLLYISPTVAAQVFRCYYFFLLIVMFGVDNKVNIYLTRSILNV